MPPPDLLGPLGLLVAALLATAVLWKDHLRADADDRAQRDRAVAIAEGLVDGLRELTAAVHAANRDAAKRHRRTDGG